MAPFRFNQKDLQVLATQSSEKFHKEGLLFFKVKEGKPFNKSEVFTERLFRLYGNLLFYFKGKDKSTECSGVIILENFTLNSDVPSSKEFCFNIEFEGEEQKYEFAAGNREDYTAWMSILKLSSYEKLRKDLEELRKEIVSISGQDPIPEKSQELELSASLPIIEGTAHEDVLMEMCLACKNLCTDGQANLSAMVQVLTVAPPETEWKKHSQTEISEEGDSPNFLRTIIISKKHSVMTRLKFIVYNVTNKSKSDVAFIGQCVCTIQEIQNAENWQLSLSIKNMDTTVGGLVIQGWERETSNPFRERGMTTVNKDHLQDNGVRSYVENIIQRSFHVPTKDGSDLKFQEFLAESSLCFTIPKLLLGLFVAEEKESVMELHNMGQLHPEWNKVQETALNSHFDLVHQYSSSLADIYQFEEERNFKKSVDKGKKELEFIPTNLHLQRECVVEKDNKEYYYDVVTVGAPTAFSLKYKHGGLRKIIRTAKEAGRKNSDVDEKKKSRFKSAANLRDVLKQSKEDILQAIKICKKAIEHENHNYLKETAVLLSSRIVELIQCYNSQFVQDAHKLLLQARTLGPSLRVDRTLISTGIEDPEYKELFWEWTGTDFKASRTSNDLEEDCGVTVSSSEFSSAVNASTTTFENRNDLLTKVLALEKCVNSCVRKTSVLMRFILMQEETEFVGMKDVRYRRDIVFSQALTPVVAGFALTLSQKVTDEFFLKQLAELGLLVHFESLLTTHGDEMCMLEDMIVGVQELSKVSFKIVSSDSETLPIVIRGKRSKVIVELPVKPKCFASLPEKLQVENIKVYPVLFSVGINEQATLAEKFGDTSLQEIVNLENFYHLEKYFEGFNQYVPNYIGSRASEPVPLKTLLDNLKTTINAKKYKDVDIFQISEELCRRLNALRLTCCKSAKDRSSMSVTLEMVRILVQEHNMTEEIFMKTLNSLRSQGTRLINAQKNVGIPKYAFNMVQVRALPNLYRPPEGTTGKSVQT